MHTQREKDRTEGRTTRNAAPASQAKRATSPGSGATAAAGVAKIRQIGNDGSGVGDTIEISYL